MLQVVEDCAVDFGEGEVRKAVLYLFWRIALQPGGDYAVDFNAPVADIPIAVTELYLMRGVCYSSAPWRYGGS